MAKNKINDLRDHLFAQLERLGDESVKPESMYSEIERAKAIAEVAKVIVESAKAETDFLHKIGGHGTGFVPDEKKLTEGK